MAITTGIKEFNSFKAVKLHFLNSPMTIRETNKRQWSDFLTDKQQEQIRTSTSEVVFRKGETIIKQGTAVTHIYLLTSGLVKLASEDGNRMTVFKIIADNTFVGLMCSFARKNFDFSALAINTSVVRIIDREVFEQVIRENGEFAMHIIELMSDLTVKIVSDLIGLSHKQANGATATILLDLAEIFNSHSFRMPFNRDEFADTVGFSKESVIGCLTSMQKDGILRVSGKNIEILDPGRLLLISRHG